MAEKLLFALIFAASLIAFIWICAKIHMTYCEMGADNESYKRQMKAFDDERQAITDAAIGAMRRGEFYGRGREVVERARDQYRHLSPRQTRIRRPC